jgi:hypothetical protein
MTLLSVSASGVISRSTHGKQSERRVGGDDRCPAGDGPHPDHAEKLASFGRLVGSWDIHVRNFDETGAVVRESTGEWHFGWVLEGRVIQDVIISPPRRGPSPGEGSKAYDTAIRVYDPRTDTWRVTVVAPIYGVTLNLVAQEHDGEIWLEGTGPEGKPVRWTFSEFTASRVRWQGYATRDDGKTWIRDEEIVLTRPSTSPRASSKAIEPGALSSAC